MRCRRLFESLLLALFIAVWAGAGYGASAVVQDQETGDQAAQTKDEEQQKEEKKELKLEDLFPEKSHFGPSANDTGFSHDGRYAAWLYRPYIERRHGSDLWILDTQSGEVKRITNVVVMSEFQENTRAVKKDREEKAKKEGVGQKKEGEKEDEKEQTTDEREDDAEPQDDPVSGVWEGKVTGGEELGLPPEGVPFKLTLQLHDDDTVSGTLEVPMTTTESTEGRFDREKGEIACTFVDADSGTAAQLTATIKDDAISGTIAVTAFNATLTLEGTRREDSAVGRPIQNGSRQDEEQDDDEEEEKKQEDDQENNDDEEIILGNWVSEKDADDDRAPRYSGIQSYVWSPVGDEMIFTSQGDLYRYDVQSGEIARLSKTREYERAVQYLPDGSGYTYMGGDSVRKVAFGEHFVEQLDPDLPGGESMIGYELSPDGSRMVFLTSRSIGPSTNRTVSIITYRNRFAEVRQVGRHVSDDPLQKRETSIYLYDMRDTTREESKLAKVFSHQVSGPRDILQVPEWSPDSEKVAFAVYTQGTGLVDIYEAVFPKKEEKPEDDDAEDEEEANEDDDDLPQERRRRGGPPASSGDEDDAEELGIEEAKVVYRFYHNGGPNTPVMIHPYYLSDSRRMVFLTEQSGFRHLHILDPIYESLEQVTNGRFEVYPFEMSKDHRYVFCTSTKEHPSREDVYVVDLDERTMKTLSKQPGSYSTVAISNDGTKCLANHVTYGELRELQFVDGSKDEQRELTDSHPEKAKEITEPTPEFFTYTNRHGHEIHGTMFKPDGWTKDDQRPLLIYVYGGPLGTRKMVNDGSYDSAGYFFAYYMAKKHGYITVTIDPRGVSGYGGVFEKSNFEQVGKPQVEDLVDGVKYLVENHGVDPKRVGMHGWSFGGFQTQMCLYTEPDVFACGIAGAGPTEWENYNSWYSQGTIGETGEGTADLKKYSLLPLAKNLKAKLLLVHGMEDSNVLYQDTVRVYRELLQADKETLVELFLDPTGGHGLGGDIETINRYRKYEEFLTRCLGSDAPPEQETEEDAEDESDENTEEDAETSDDDGD